MTLIVSTRVPDGIVIAADSMSTIRMQSPQLSAKGKTKCPNCGKEHDFSAAVEHAAQAADDACKKAGDEVDKGNAELQKCINAYADNHPDKAQGSYDSAVKNYDKALDLIGG